MEPLRSEQPLIVYIDYKSPYAFLAIEPTYRLEDEYGVQIDWRPLTLDVPSYLGSARQDDSGKLVENNRTPRQWLGVKYAYKDARRYARLRDYPLRGTTKIWDSSLAAIGLLWARRDPPALRRYTTLVCDRFWRRELDIENPAVVEGALAEAELDTAGFRAYLEGDGRAAHDALQDQLHPAGLFGVPTYIIDGEVYFGREHLPSVRWHLEGRTGPAPDVAYEDRAP